MKSARRALAAGETLTVAVPKGRLLVESSDLFERALGVSPKRLLEGTRRLGAEAPKVGLRFISVRAADVASYVEHGAADVGIVGLDVLREEPRDLYEPLDLGIGRCTMVVARPRRARPLQTGVAPRVATKYVNIAARHFGARGVPAEVIPLRGSIEVAPSLGLADLVVDISETGATLEANGLVVQEKVMEVTARLVVNRVAMKLHADRLRMLVIALRSAAAVRLAARRR